MSTNFQMLIEKLKLKKIKIKNKKIQSKINQKSK